MHGCIPHAIVEQQRSNHLDEKRLKTRLEVLVALNLCSALSTKTTGGHAGSHTWVTGGREK